MPEGKKKKRTRRLVDIVESPSSTPIPSSQLLPPLPSLIDQSVPSEQPLSNSSHQSSDRSAQGDIIPPVGGNILSLTASIDSSLQQSTKSPFEDEAREALVALQSYLDAVGPSKLKRGRLADRERRTLISAAQRCFFSLRSPDLSFLSPETRTRVRAILTALVEEELPVPAFHWNDSTALDFVREFHPYIDRDAVFISAFTRGWKGVVSFLRQIDDAEYNSETSSGLLSSKSSLRKSIEKLLSSGDATLALSRLRSRGTLAFFIRFLPDLLTNPSCCEGAWRHAVSLFPIIPPTAVVALLQNHKMQLDYLRSLMDHSPEARNNAEVIFFLCSVELKNGSLLEAEKLFPLLTMEQLQVLVESHPTIPALVMAWMQSSPPSGDYARWQSKLLEDGSPQAFGLLYNSPAAATKEFIRKASLSPRVVPLVASSFGCSVALDLFPTYSVSVSSLLHVSGSEAAYSSTLSGAIDTARSSFWSDSRAGLVSPQLRAIRTFEEKLEPNALASLPFLDSHDIAVSLSAAAPHFADEPTHRGEVIASSSNHRLRTLFL